MHTQFCYMPEGPCYFLTCTCHCHELCGVHGFRQPCFECRLARREQVIAAVRAFQP